jgi:hypothetical protein|tara:strand:- start:957 stop:1190 length:234 start_codon:yes stop_codon:yes gene_type:complete
MKLLPRQPADDHSMTAEWRSGPRTPAWDELWRRILADVLSEIHRPERTDETVVTTESDHTKATSDGSIGAVEGGPNR